MNKKELYAMRHSMAHITASAVKRLWPEAKFGVGPVVDHGFYYDIDLGETKLSDSDFPKIEEQMKKVIDENQDFIKSDKEIDEAISWAKDNNQPYKEELLNDLKREGTTSAKDIDPQQLGSESGESQVSAVSFYTNGDFEDLCRGPHISNTSKAGSFKLTKVSGAYWRGDEAKPQMQRLYGVAFAGKDELENHLKMLEEARTRDHRKIGKEMNLFVFSPLVGSGLPLFTPKGTVVKDKLVGYSEQIKESMGFERVSIPHITKTSLYEKSGHMDKFGDELFLVQSQETSDKMALKPMNCPHHTQIYASEPRSYRDLPQKYYETTVVYRDEKSGELNGLERVRAITQDDSHVFCSEDQVNEIVSDLISKIHELYDTLGMSIKWVRLSYRDESDSYLGDSELWEFAQKELEKLARANNLQYKIEEGEAAFYGPKIDFMAADALGRETQVATVQLDLVQPSRFGLEYVDSKGEKKTPVMIHPAILGSVERFMSVYIESTGGDFPFWLSPEQVRILTVNDSVIDYANKVTELLKEVVINKPLKYNELRVKSDMRSESLGKKIRDAEKDKVPLIIIVGPKDEANSEVSIRTRKGESKVRLEELKGYIESNNKEFN